MIGSIKLINFELIFLNSFVVQIGQIDIVVIQKNNRVMINQRS